MPDGYPGHFAPASLKQGHPRLQGFCRVGYPGHFAPASLKRPRNHRDGDGVVGLSGAFRPGLIEALWSVAGPDGAE